MDNKSIPQMADSFGLTIESVHIPDHENAIRVYKGAKQIFIGTEEAVRAFLETYKDDLPAPAPPPTPTARGFKE